MRVLSISSDRKIFEKGSNVLLRLLDQASLLEELIIVVFTLENQHYHGFTEGKLTVLPTNSKSKYLYIRDAYKISNQYQNIDIISTQDPFESGIVGLLLKWKLKAKLQMQIHTDIMSPFFRKSNFLNFLRFLISRFTIVFADGIRAVSERIKISLERSFSKKLNIDVLPVFVDLKRPGEGVFVDLHTKYSEFDFIIVTVSRLEKEKNLPLLIDAFNDALVYIKGAGLVIIGDGSERLALERRVKDLGIEKSVKFVGWQKDLVGFYESADLYVSTSNFEGYGLSLLEAGFYGLPIVSTDVGIMGEVYKDNVGGLVCPVGDKDCLVHKIVEIRKFVDVRTRISNGARISARGAIWAKENHKNKFLKLWKKLI